MKNLCIGVFVFLFVSQTAFANEIDWGNTGHRAIGQIAEAHLSKKIKRKIKALLDGQSLAMVSTFADDIKSDRKYSNFYTWHYVNLNDNDTYESSVKNPQGDLVTGIEKCKQVLLDDKATKADKAFYLKMLVHLIGDLHQPMHVGRLSDKGGNTFQVQWFNNGTNMHRIWDSQMIDSFNMTYTELASNTDDLNKKQIKAIAQGTVVSWVNETKGLAQEVYGSAKTGEKLGYRYMYDHFATVRSQLQKGGIRLAKVLEEVLR
ncbi:endonuclease [Polaribacter pacificus]|uniref:Endonuclease n=1 Tax=Polaribacter pacificus TaxID=1775173 RepID=A0A917I042_9FLAO|nr:S1/P1 nuclease [Polaribacter pacificus]GGH00702.1 endonuclease [Polaribacter pacificus]